MVDNRLLLSWLVALQLLSGVLSDCNIYQQVRTYKVNDCQGAAVEVDVKVSKCTKDGDMISATLSDDKREKVFSHFSGICGKKEGIPVCKAGSSLVKKSRGWISRDKCHVRTEYFYKVEWPSDEDGYWYERIVDQFKKNKTYSGHSYTYVKSNGYTKYNDKSIWLYNSKSEYWNPRKDITFYYKTPVSSGYLYPQYEQSFRQTSKKTIVCIPHDHDNSDMKLNYYGNSKLSLGFQPLKGSHAISNSVTTIDLTRSTEFEWEKDGGWTLSVLKVFTVDNKTDAENLLSVDVKSEFLVLQLDQIDEQNGTDLKLILLTQFCDSVKNFDGSTRKQNFSLYKTFTSTVTVTLSIRSTPALGVGDWFVAIYTEKKVLLDEEAFDLKIKKVPFRKSFGSMFIIPLATGFVLVALYHISTSLCSQMPIRTLDQREKSQSRNNEVASEKSGLKLWFYYTWKAPAWRTHNFFAFSITLTLVFLVPAFQFVWSSYFISESTGNKDICYYNDKCFFPSYWFPADFPINALSSNLPYLVHGGLIILYVAILELRCHLNGHEKYCDYSVAQAVGFSLVAIGLFSLTYHICPTRAIFQLDTNGMFLCATIIIVAVFHGRSGCAEDQRVRDSKITSDIKASSRKPFRASAVFISFLCPMIILNYIGSVIDVEDIDSISMLPVVLKNGLTGIRVVVCLFFVMWYVMVVAWGLRKNRIDMKARLSRARASASKCDRFCRSLPAIGFLIFIVLIGIYVTLGFARPKMDSSTALMNAVVGFSIVTLLAGEWRHIMDLRPSGTTKTKKRLYYFFLSVFYLIFLAFWAGAFWFFAVVGTSNKNQKPSESRTKNQECIMMDYYDPHDLWHFLSSHGLLLTGLRAVSLAFSCRLCRYVNIHGERKTGSATQDQTQDQTQF